jgi:hypothetical protein
MEASPEKAGRGDPRRSSALVRHDYPTTTVATLVRPTTKLPMLVERMYS